MISQVIGVLAGVSIAFIGGFIVYWLINKFAPMTMDEEEQYRGADLVFHKTHANPPKDEF
jgi:Amt family ammonium transporter